MIRENFLFAIKGAQKNCLNASSLFFSSFTNEHCQDEKGMKAVKSFSLSSKERGGGTAALITFFISPFNCSR